MKVAHNPFWLGVLNSKKYVFYFIKVKNIFKINKNPQSHYRVVKWNLIFVNFAYLRHVINKDYEADVILYSHKKCQPNPCTCARA